MGHGHIATHGFLRESNHLRLLPVVGAGQEIAAARMSDFFMRIDLLRIADVVHKVTDLPHLGLVRLLALYFLNDHAALP